MLSIGLRVRAMFEHPFVSYSMEPLWGNNKLYSALLAYVYVYLTDLVSRWRLSGFESQRYTGMLGISRLNSDYPG